MMADVEIIVRDEQTVEADMDAIAEAARHTVARVLGKRAEGCEVSILLVTEEAIRKLNAAHRGIDRATDVLSYSQCEVFELAPGELLGDIVLCPEVGVAQAEATGRSAGRELLMLVVHGVLHLVGYDHVDDAERDEMFGLQEQLLDELGA